MMYQMKKPLIVITLELKTIMFRRVKQIKYNNKIEQRLSANPLKNPNKHHDSKILHWSKSRKPH